MPDYLRANIQYGKNVQALITYLSVYQLVPAKRLKQFLKDFTNLNISEGTIFNILSSMSNKAQPVYVSDRLAAQLKIKSLAKQLCLSHLSRELKKVEEVFSSKWAIQMKTLFKKAISYKKQMQEGDYFSRNHIIQEFEKELSLLLDVDYKNKHIKEQAFIKRLQKRRDAIFSFLYYKEVPPDNNAYERGIRNLKVKMKISNQFKSYTFAQHFAVIRSVIDTTIKNGQDVFNALSNLASQDLNPTE